MVKQLDPSTATAAELAQASRSLRRATQVSIVVGLAGAALAFSPVMDSTLAEYGFMILVLVGAGSYRVAYEVLSRMLPPN